MLSPPPAHSFLTKFHQYYDSIKKLMPQIESEVKNEWELFSTSLRLLFDDLQNACDNLEHLKSASV